MGPGQVDRGGINGSGVEPVKELVAAEAGVALAAVGVEDPQLRPPPRRAESVPRDHHLRPLADDVPAEADPAAPGELQPEAGRLRDGVAEPGPRGGRLEEDEERGGPPGERGETMEAIGDAGGPCGRLEARRQVDDEEVHRPAAEETAGDREALVEAVRRDDDEPLEADPAGNRLDRVEAPAGVQPGDDRAARLGLRDEAEREGRLAAPALAAEGDARRARQPAGTEDRVEGREPGRDDPVRRAEQCSLRHLLGQRRGRERADDLPDLSGYPRSCRAPARLEGRESSRHVRGEARHRTVIIEQMFYSSTGLSARRHLRTACVVALESEAPPPSKPHPSSVDSPAQSSRGAHAGSYHAPSAWVTQIRRGRPPPGPPRSPPVPATGSAEGARRGTPPRRRPRPPARTSWRGPPARSPSARARSRRR